MFGVRSSCCAPGSPSCPCFERVCGALTSRGLRVVGGSGCCCALFSAQVTECAGDRVSLGLTKGLLWLGWVQIVISEQPAKAQCLCLLRREDGATTVGSA